MTDRDAMDRYVRTSFTYNGVMRETYSTKRDDGPGVLLMHELPGLSPGTFDLADFLADEGFRVTMPLMFGRPGQGGRGCGIFPGMAQTLCIRAEFLAMQWQRSSPIAEWMRGLARRVAADTGGPIGVIGMCLTGGFAMSMVWDPAIAAGVAAQPALPFRLRKNRISVSEADLVASMQSETPVLAIRFKDDRKLSPEQRLAAVQRRWEGPSLEVRNYADKWATDPPDKIRRCERIPHATLTAGFDRAVDGEMTARRHVLDFLVEHLT